MRKPKNWAWLCYGLLPILLTLFLSPAMAEGYGLFVAGVEVTSENCSNLGGLDGVTLGTKGELKYDPDSKTLSMTDVTMNLDGKQAVRNESVSDFKIQVMGNNHFTVTHSDALSFSADATIQGEGTLTLNSTQSAVWTKATLTISDVTLNAYGKNGLIGHRWYNGCDGKLIIKNARLDVRGSDLTIGALNAFTLEGCKIVVPTQGKWDKDQNAVVMGNKKASWVKIIRESETFTYHGFYIAGTPITDGNVDNLKEITGVTVPEGGELKYEKATKTLTMKNVTVKDLNWTIAFHNESAVDLTLDVQGDNSFSTQNADALRFEASTTIKGEGALTVKTNRTHSGVFVDNGVTLTLENLTFSTEGKRGFLGDSDKYGQLVVRNATVHAKGSDDALIIGDLKLDEARITNPGLSWNRYKHAVMNGPYYTANNVTIEPSYGFSIAGTPITAENVNKLKEITGVTVPEGGELKYEKATKTLTMKNVTVNNLDGKIAFHNECVVDLKIDVQGNNLFSTQNADALRFDASTTIKGDGQLTAKTSATHSGVYILENVTLTLENLTVDADGRKGILGAGDKNGKLVVRNATLHAKGSDGAIVLGALEFEGSRIATPGASWDGGNHAVMKGGIKATEVTIEPFYGFYIAGEAVTPQNVSQLNKLTGVTVLEGGELKYDPATKTLTMKNVTVKDLDGKLAFHNQGVNDLTINVSGENKFFTQNADALRFDASTTIKGDGQLMAKTSATHSGVFILENVTLTLENLTVDADGRKGILGAGDKNGKLVVRNATLHAKGSDGAIVLGALEFEETRITTPGAWWVSDKHAVMKDGARATEVTIEPSYGLYIAGEPISAKNCRQLGKIQGVFVPTEGEFAYDKESKTLTMKNVTITLNDDTHKGTVAIHNEGVPGLTIVCEGNNKIATKDADGVQFHANASITGEGTLSVRTEGNYSAIYVPQTALTIENATLDLEGKNGIFGDKSLTLTIKNARVDAKSHDLAIGNFDAFTLEGGKIAVPAGGAFDSGLHAVAKDGAKARWAKIIREDETFTYYGLLIAGVPVTSENIDKLDKIDKVTVGGELKYDPTNKLLSLKDVSIEDLDGKVAICNELIPDLTISLSGNNKIATRNASGLLFNLNTTITGAEGMLTVNTEGPSSIWLSDGTLTIADTNLELSGDQAIEGARLATRIDIRRATVSMTAQSSFGVIYCVGDFNLQGCRVVEPLGGSWNSITHELAKRAKKVRIEPTYDFSIAGVLVTPANAGKLNEIPGVTVPDGGELKYDPATNTLSMKDVTIKLDTEELKGKIAIHNDQQANLKIAVSGDNKITVKDADAFQFNASTEIEGNGSISLVSDRTSIWVPTATLTLSNLTLHSNGRWGLAGHNGSQGELIINDATVNAKGFECAIGNFKTFTLNGCSIVTPAAGGWDDAQHAIMDGSEKAKEVSIVPFVFRLDPMTLGEVNAAGGALSVKVVANSAWTLTVPTDATWVTPSVTSGDGDATVTFDVVANGSLASRSATLTFTQPASAKTLSLEIKQMPITPIFSLAPTTVAEVSVAGGKPSVKLTSNNAWTLTLDPADATWVTPSVTSGDGDATVTFDVAANPTPSVRSVTATFTQAESNKTLTLEIQQAGVIPLTGLTIDPAQLPLKVGASTKLTLKFVPANATNKKVTWAVTEGAASLTVDQEGNITATQVAGTAKVTVTSQENSTLTATCTVNVTLEDVPVESLTLSETTLSLSVGESQQLTTTVKPQTATNKTVTWTVTEGAGVVSVSDGLVTALKAGSATVTATAGGKSVSCAVTVTEAPKPVVFSLEPLTIAEVPAAGGEPSVKLTSNRAWTLTIPSEATWVTSSVKDGEAGTELPVTFTVIKNETPSPRSVTVTFTQADTNETLTLTIQQAAQEVVTVPLTDIKLSDTQLTLKVGESAKLSVTFTPDNATNKAVTWAVSEGAASLTVDQEGNITATQVVGTAKVTVTSQENPSIAATCTVTVTAATVPQAVEDALLAKVVVAPNPFTTQLQVVNPEGTPAAYELVSLSGVVLRAGMSDGTETEIDTADLPAGLYFVRLTGENGAQRTVRVVKY